MGPDHRVRLRPLPREDGEGEALAEGVPRRGHLRSADRDGGLPESGGARRNPGHRARGGRARRCRRRAGGVPMTDEKGIVEAALFSAGRPVTVEDLAQSTGVEPGKVREHLKAIASDYASRASAVEVAPVGGKWTMQIRMEYTERARGFAPPEIERDLLKTVALVAYHQPILQSDLGDMIGSKVYEHVHALADLNLINKKPSGRSFELTT
ncbi:MAG: SMC-Scp complex subunit ScpB, partial [Methanobacteriota archaeon]